MGVMNNDKQLSDVTRTDGPHGSITFTGGGSSYSYSASSSTAHAFSFLVQVEDTS